MTIWYHALLRPHESFRLNRFSFGQYGGMKCARARSPIMRQHPQDADVSRTGVEVNEAPEKLALSEPDCSGAG
jgi:hypothetical protein